MLARRQAGSFGVQAMLTRHTERGFSLVELMVGIVVGMIVISGAIALYVNTIRGSTYSLRAMKLNQELRAVMDLMVSDIRRAGYWSGAVNGGNVATGVNPFTLRTTGTETDIDLITGADGCILFAYDRSMTNINGPVTTVEIFGFRRLNDQIQLRTGGTASTVDAATACPSTTTTTSWESITDGNTVVIDELRFSTENSQCLNMSKDESWKVDATTAGTNDIHAGTDIVACSGTVGSGVSWNPRFNGTTWTNPTGANTSSTGNKLVETRQITVSLRGHHRDDPSSAITLVENVQVQNDRVFAVP